MYRDRVSKPCKRPHQRRANAAGPPGYQCHSSPRIVAHVNGALNGSGRNSRRFADDVVAT